MRDLLKKELKLAASPLSYFFTAGALLAFMPGYPILLGAFFTTLGIFYSFQTMRENNDLNYTLLLPVAKADVVRSKFLFTVVIEGFSFSVMAVVTAVRMAWLSTAAAYVSNALMGANLTFLGFALVLFGLFNAVFLTGFFRTGYFFGKPFILYAVFSLLVITLAEALHYFPGLGALNALGPRPLFPQLGVLLGGAAVFAVCTLCGLRRSIRLFEAIDL